MAATLTITVGASASATITFNGTNAQAQAALTRYATSLGIPTSGTAVENLTAILEHFRDDIRSRSKEVEKKELRAANEATIQATVDSDNNI